MSADSNPLSDLEPEEVEALKEIARARASGSISRRDALKAGGALGVGALLGGGASQSIGTASAAASSSDGDGDIGSPSNRVDIFADGIDANSIAQSSLDIASLANQDYNEDVNTQTAQSGTVTIDLSVANIHQVEADGDITISFSNVTQSPAGNSVLIYVYDSDGTGSHAISWPASVQWSGGSAVSSVASNSDVEIMLWSPDGGSTWYGRKGGENFS